MYVEYYRLRPLKNGVNPMGYIITLPLILIAGVKAMCGR